MSATCRSCRAPIVWGETTGGKRMPLDPEPVPDGNVLVTSLTLEGTSLERREVRVIGASEAVHPDRERYVSHFVTCPRAASHRRR